MRQLMRFIFDTFWVWKLFILASQGGSLSVTQGRIVFPLYFWDQIFLYFYFRIFRVISSTFWVWNFFIWASQGGSSSVTQGLNVFLLCFWDRFFYIFLLGSLEWYLAHFEFEKFSFEHPKGVFKCHPGANCVSFIFLGSIFLYFSFRIFGVISGTFWVWKIFIWAS